MAAVFLAALEIMPDSTASAIALPFLVITLALTAAASTGWLLILHAWLENRASSQAAAGLPPGAGGPPPARSSGEPGQAGCRANRDLGTTAEAAPRPSARVRPHIAPAH